MRIDFEHVVKQIVYVAILVVTLSIGAWLTTSRIQWPLLLAVAAAYLMIRLVVLPPRAHSRQ